MKADQHYRHVTRNGWSTLPCELIAYACNLCDHLVEIPSSSATALRGVRAGALAKARARMRAHLLDRHAKQIGQA